MSNLDSDVPRAPRRRRALSVDFSSREHLLARPPPPFGDYFDSSASSIRDLQFPTDALTLLSDSFQQDGLFGRKGDADGGGGSGFSPRKSRGQFSADSEQRFRGNLSGLFFFTLSLFSAFFMSYLLFSFLNSWYISVRPFSYNQEMSVLFSANPFFSDRLIYSPEMITQLSQLFTLQTLQTGEGLVLDDGFTHFLIVEQGTLSATPGENPEHAAEYISSFFRGDSIGGMNMLHGRRHNINLVVSSETPAAVWVANAPALNLLLQESVLLRSILEKRFIQAHIEKRRKKPILYIPGFASSRLIAWRRKSCSAMNIEIGDVVWLNLEKVLHHNLFEEACWIKCMMLDIVDQTDPEGCKLRPEEGMGAIYDLLNGVLAPVTAIFRNLVYYMAHHFSYDISSMLALPYDWRIAPKLLEDRDALFSKMKFDIEHTVRMNRNPAIALCHSMGCKLFLYFVEWMKLHYPKIHEEWFDAHIWMFVSVAPPLLGSVQSVRGMISGVGFSLPINSMDSRLMGVSFSSAHFLLPSNITIAENLVPAHSNTTLGNAPSLWPDHLVVIKAENGTTTTFSPSEIISGQMYRTLHAMLSDSEYDKFYQALDKFYFRDPVWLELEREGPARPPIRQILTIYGRNLQTDLGYHYKAVTRNNGKMSLIMESEIFESSGGKILATSSHSLLPSSAIIGQSRYPKSGDGTVPYASLSWSHTWHHDNVQVKNIPARSAGDVDTLISKLYQDLGGTLAQSGFVHLDLLQQFHKSQSSYSRYQSTRKAQNPDTEDDSHVIVLEIDGLGHRDVIRDHAFTDGFIREFLRLAKREFLLHNPEVSHARLGDYSCSRTPRAAVFSHTCPVPCRLVHFV
ncbi:hypothetical protein H696_06047 [Fonticula alba]|uniref:Cyclic nucleotide-binding domain-containing protein n=1 Tax=Fonticula alba TaxID=691883 RepID=A0A058YZW3_FONAL|nr:hypothetical protein H696_06047 [Fonticula alba]KCV67529.1 hypothetical protein H696_06047 [Fonticula alba]|eukprot:XP_009498090.1 hypothetical protein H696_06047 [Fonticula alba]